MEDYEKMLYQRYAEEIEKITSGINLIREGMEFIISTQKRLNSDWIHIDTDLPHPSWKEIEVTTSSGERKIATYLWKRKIWIDSDFNKIDVIAWKKPSPPYKINEQDLHNYQTIEYSGLLNYPQSYMKKKIVFAAKVEDEYWFTSEADDENSEYAFYNTLELKNEITEKRIEVWYDPTELKCRIYPEDTVLIYGKIHSINSEELIIIGKKLTIIL